MAVLHHQSVLSVDVIDVTRGIPVHEHIIMYIVVKLFVLHGRNLKFDKSEHLNHCLLSKNSFWNYQHLKFLLNISKYTCRLRKQSFPDMKSKIICNKFTLMVILLYCYKYQTYIYRQVIK